MSFGELRTLMTYGVIRISSSSRLVGIRSCTNFGAGSRFLALLTMPSTDVGQVTTGRSWCAGLMKRATLSKVSGGGLRLSTKQTHIQATVHS